MTLLVTPYEYRGVSLSGATGIDAQKFQIPAPIALTGIIPVAGGDFFDFNYGNGAKLRPAPFTITTTVFGNTAAQLGTIFNNFFGLPPTGFYGEIGTFKVMIHGSFTFLTCEAELTSIQYTGDGSWWSTAKKRISGMQVTYTPVDMFA